MQPRTPWTHTKVYAMLNERFLLLEVPAHIAKVRAAGDTTIPPPYALQAEDLVFYTRKPLFVIVESHSSTAFKVGFYMFVHPYYQQDFSRRYSEQPLIILMSPAEYPGTLQGSKVQNFLA